MGLSNFNKDELALIEILLQSSNKINSIYDKLYKLEITKQKDSPEYNNQLEMLKKAIKSEKKKYQNANLTSEQQYKIIELLANTPNSLKISDTFSIIKQDDNDKLIRRVINILISQTITNIDYSKILNEVLEIIKALGIPIDDEELSKDINNQSRIELAINNDINLVFLAILQESSSLFKYSEYKNELKKAIYNTSFINIDIEGQLIENNFNLPDNIYISSKLINDILKTEPTIYNRILSIIVQTQIIMHIKSLLEIKDENYNNRNTNISSIINQCYIRALLTFMNDDEIYKLNEQFHELIESPTYLKDHPKDRISEEIIIKCFKSVKYDRVKKRTISLYINNSN